MKKEIQMGIPRARFIIDTHVHSQRHIVKKGEKKGMTDYKNLSRDMRLMETYDNSPRLLYDMERYGVDMCMVQPAFGMTNEINAEQVKKYPDKFIAMCLPVETMKKCLTGEKDWTAEAAAEELDGLLSTGIFRGGIGEGFPRHPKPERMMTWLERLAELRLFMDVAKKHRVCVSYHTGAITGYSAGSSRRMSSPETLDPMLAFDLAAEYPDVPIILSHGGMQGWWSEKFMDDCFQAAATFENIYLETGLYWADLYERPLNDPNIGAKKLIWGTDWGANLVVYRQPGGNPQSYADQIKAWGPAKHQPDIFGWSLRQVDKMATQLDLSQDDLNLILGGNAVRLFGIEMPHTRLFRE
jgi:predicted TIM-barrel fold metal-dependent hydrolase